MYGCDASPICDAAELQGALDGAHPGDRVTVGACRIEGSFQVPAGVILAGQGPETSTLAAAEALATALDVTPGTVGQPTRIEGLSVEHDGGFAIRAADVGELEVRDVVICSARGVGLGIEGLDRLLLEDIGLEGPITASSASMLGDLYDATDTATFGVALFSVGDAQLRRVSIVGYGEAGLVASRSTLSWTDGSSDVNLGVGIRLERTTATLTNVSARNTLRGFRGVPSYGVFSSNSAVTTTNMVVSDSQQGFGLIHVGGDVTHANLVANDNGGAGLLAQEMDSFSMEGTTTQLMRNEFAGVLVLDSPAAELRDLTVESTALVMGLPTGFETVMMGDGVQLVRSDGSRVTDAILRNNERVGVLADLAGGSTSSLTLSNVTVEGTGTQLGAVVQNGTAEPGWDGTVTRLGATLTNDLAFTGGLDISNVVGPGDFPPAGPLMRAETEGIDGIVAPCD
ncbi:MAG: hypothetical protein H6719_00500 [Sandaracinaceae bacterium]|nr:hypothetical protein [Sandaracinaceae bacterium]